MTTVRRVRATLGVDKQKIVDVLNRAQAMYNGMNADKVTYASPNPTLPAFIVLIQNLTTAEQAAQLRPKGAAATRNAQRDLLWTASRTSRCSLRWVSA